MVQPLKINGGLLSGTPVYHLVHQLNINTLTGKMPLEEGHNLMCGINSGQSGDLYKQKNIIIWTFSHEVKYEDTALQSTF